ncbi:hypothetical protein F443_10401 [Phytophthora nicotianae P1569]|uniref:Uncharacterized protein n=1 Tax=Phytophthora nicotianae P1569 TaxID=1317065 RepID=V9F3Q0_PHYNI|nr:hypothetical protein F443_10401 [Phytophthora nicotianae P1569]
MLPLVTTTPFVLNSTNRFTAARTKLWETVIAVDSQAWVAQHRFLLHVRPQTN